MHRVGDGGQLNTGKPGHLNIVKSDQRTRQKVGPVDVTFDFASTPFSECQAKI